MTFEQYWAEVQGQFPSQTSAHFAKPLLRDAFNAGRASAPKREKRIDFGIDTIDRAPDVR